MKLFTKHFYLIQQLVLAVYTTKGIHRDRLNWLNRNFYFNDVYYSMRASSRCYITRARLPTTNLWLPTCVCVSVGFLLLCIVQPFNLQWKWSFLNFNKYSTNHRVLAAKKTPNIYFLIAICLHCVYFLPVQNDASLPVFFFFLKIK